MNWDRGDLTSAIVAMLGDWTGFAVGDHAAPSERDDKRPWMVVYSIPGGDLTGPMIDPQADVTCVYQVTSAGATRAQAEKAADRARRTMLDATAELVVAGAKVIGRQVDTLGGVTIEGAVFSVPDRYAITVTPL